MKTLILVIPCYNEEIVLPTTFSSFLSIVSNMINTKLISPNSKICFVDDGSDDTTWDIISRYSRQYSIVSGISLSTNKGHQNALLCGLLENIDSGDIFISIDCDGQDDLNIIPKMVQRNYDGDEIVYGVRKSRKKDTFLKKYTALTFYRFMDMMGVKSIYNHADYRLISKTVLAHLSNFQEVNTYLRGLFPIIGFKSSKIFYDRDERIAGESHYTFSKMLNLAVNGITSFSTKPLRLITILGISIATVSFLILLWTLVEFALGKTVKGWTSILSAISFLSGIQLLFLGVIGEYIGKIYMETKKRPKYIVREKINMNNR